jgi:hypothetical protein
MFLLFLFYMHQKLCFCLSKGDLLTIESYPFTLQKSHTYQAKESHLPLAQVVV